MQELNTARSCIEKVFPEAQITNNCVDVYPIKVIVSTKMGAQNIKIWEGRQQSLFGKNRADRTRSMAEIVERLEELKEDCN